MSGSLKMHLYVRNLQYITPSAEIVRTWPSSVQPVLIHGFSLWGFQWSHFTPINVVWTVKVFVDWLGVVFCCTGVGADWKRIGLSFSRARSDLLHLLGVHSTVPRRCHICWYSLFSSLPIFSRSFCVCLYFELLSYRIDTQPETLIKM